jgi:Spy/CpxP family protein refolding chaperone
MRRYILFVIIGLTLAGGAAGALAFEQPGAGLGGFQEQILEIKRGQMGPALGIDQRTVDQLLQIDQRYKPLRAQMRKDMQTEFRNLQQIMQQTNPSDQTVKANLDNLHRKRLEMLNLQQKQHEEEMAILTPVQQARYLMFLMGLRQQLSKEARTLRGAPTTPKSAVPMTPPGTPKEVGRPAPQ